MWKVFQEHFFFLIIWGTASNSTSLWTIDRISEKEYIKTIQEEIAKVIKLQEELDLDVLVHGEPEVSTPQLISMQDISMSWKKSNELSITCCREMTWWNTLESSFRDLHSQSMAGFSLMDLVALSHQLYMEMLVAPTLSLSFGQSIPRAWLLVPWKECLLDLSQFWIGPL